MTHLEIHPCPACDGTGSIHFSAGYEDRKSRWPLNWEEPCEECKGTGNVEIEVEDLGEQ